MERGVERERGRESGRERGIERREGGGRERGRGRERKRGKEEGIKGKREKVITSLPGRGTARGESTWRDWKRVAASKRPSSSESTRARYPSLSIRWTERQFFIDNLLIRIHFIIVMVRWTGLAPWEFEFPFQAALHLPS